MANDSHPYRFLLMPASGKWAANLPKEQRLGNMSAGARAALDDVQWDIHAGGSSTGWVMNREAFALAAAAMVPMAREACESGKYNALVILGGGDPGYTEAREIAARYGIAVTASGWSAMHIACMLGKRFSVIDLPESHNIYYADLIAKYRLSDRCASIRNIDNPDSPPGSLGKDWLFAEKDRALKGESVPVVTRAIAEAVAAIEEDGADVITFGCGGTFWLQPFVEKGLRELGWEVPVLDGYQCSIAAAKLLVNVGQSASGLTFPATNARKWRRKKFV